MKTSAGCSDYADVGPVIGQGTIGGKKERGTGNGGKAGENPTEFGVFCHCRLLEENAPVVEVVEHNSSAERINCRKEMNGLI